MSGYSACVFWDINIPLKFMSSRGCYSDGEHSKEAIDIQSLLLYLLQISVSGSLLGVSRSFFVPELDEGATLESLVVDSQSGLFPLNRVYSASLR